MITTNQREKKWNDRLGWKTELDEDDRKGGALRRDLVLYKVTVFPVLVNFQRSERERNGACLVDYKNVLASVNARTSVVTSNSWKSEAC